MILNGLRRHHCKYQRLYGLVNNPLSRSSCKSSQSRREKAREKGRRRERERESTPEPRVATFKRCDAALHPTGSKHRLRAKPGPVFFNSPRKRERRPLIARAHLTSRCVPASLKVVLESFPPRRPEPRRNVRPLGPTTTTRTLCSFLKIARYR